MSSRVEFKVVILSQIHSDGSPTSLLVTFTSYHHIKHRHRIDSATGVEAYPDRVNVVSPVERMIALKGHLKTALSHLLSRPIGSRYCEDRCRIQKSGLVSTPPAHEAPPS